MKMAKNFALITVLSSLAMFGAACEYQSDPAPSGQASQQDSPNTVAQPSSSGGTSSVGPSNPSALSGAKRAADSVISQAEQASQNVANEADRLGGGGG